MLAPPGFRALTPCGAGATSQVFRAEQIKPARTVALKRLNRHLVPGGDAVARLLREFKALEALRHSAIVPVFDVIRWGGDPTIVMAYVSGRDLKDRITEGKLPAPEAERIFRVLLEVLATVHGAGIVHRDVKPQNIRLDEGGQIYLLDFGSARLEAASNLTATGTSVGTPEYMAPELFAGPVYDPRVDLFGAAATLFEALTGRPPQLAESLAELAEKRSHVPIEPIRTLVDVPEALAQVIDRCLALDPDERPSSAAAALWALDHPAAERGYQARRKHLPRCLHCSARIPPESASCPACAIGSPFVYPVGHRDVVLESISDPERYATYAREVAPALSSPAGDTWLAHQIAQLSFRPVQHIRGVSESVAARLVDELGQAGAHARAEAPETVGTQGAQILLCTALLSLALCSLTEPSQYLLVAAGFVVALRFTHMSGASVLDTEGRLYPVGHGLGVASILLGTGFLASSALLARIYPAARAEWLRFGQIAFGLAAILAVAGYATGLPPPLRKHESPSATGAERLRLWVAQHERAPSRRSAAPTAARSGLSFGLIALICTIMFLEISAVSSARHALISIDGAELRAKARAPKRPVAPAARESAAAPRRPVEAAPLPAGQAPAPTSGVPTLLWLLALLPLPLSAWTVFCQRRLRHTAERLQASFPPRIPAPRTNARQASPTRRSAATRAASQDPFVRSARVRAAAFLPLLGPAESERFERELAALDTGEADSASRNALLARCILETDHGLELRFRHLALEGEFETRAALAFAAGQSEAPR